METQWAGVFPAVTTKFEANHALDFDAMAAHFDAQIRAGVHGLIVTGTLGENASLTVEEKLAVLGHALDVSAGRVPVLAGVAETTTAGACEVVRRGAAHGADGFMVLPGMLYKSDPRETLHHFQTIARATDHPLMVYNNPVSYGVDVTPEMFVQLAEEPNIVAIKESSDDVRRITRIINLTGDRFQVFTGVDDLALESLLMGAVGWVAGLVCAFPEETVAVYNLALAGRLEEARALYRWFTPLLRLDVSTKLVQNIKLAEAIVGLGNERVRPPRLPLAGAERAEVTAIIEQALAVRPPLTSHA